MKVKSKYIVTIITIFIFFNAFCKALFPLELHIKNKSKSKKIKLQILPYYKFSYPFLYKNLFVKTIKFNNSSKVLNINLPLLDYYYIQITDEKKNKKRILFQKVISYKYLELKRYHLFIKFDDKVSLEGRILNLKNEPIKNALICLYPDVGEQITPQIYYTWTDEKGYFAFYNLNFKYYTLIVTNSEYMPVSYSGILSGVPITLKMKKGGVSVEGMVIGNRDYKPIKRAELQLVGPDFSIFKIVEEDGNFEFKNLPNGKYYIQPMKKGIFMGKPTVFEINSVPIQGLIVTMNQGINVSGKVINKLFDIPLSNVELRIKDVFGEKISYSDPNGHFSFVNVIPQRNIEIFIDDENYRVYNGEYISKKFSYGTFQPEEDVENIILYLLPQIKISGRLFGKNKKSRLFGKMIIYDPNSFSIKLKKIKVEKNIFEFKTFNPGIFYLWFWNSIGDITNLVKIYPEKDKKTLYKLDLKLQKGAEVKIKVIDENENILKNSVVKIYLSDIKIPYKKYNYTSEYLKIKDLPLSKVKIKVENPLYSQKLTQVVVLKSSSNISRVFEFKVLGLIEGNVFDGENNPLEGVKVTYITVENGIPEEKCVYTNEKGFFRITDIKNNFVNLTFYKKGYKKESFKKVDVPTKKFKVVLNKLSVYQGIIYNYDGELYSGEISMNFKSNNGKSNLFTVKVMNGKYEIRGLEAGCYEVSVRDLNKGMHYTGYWNIEYGQNLPIIYLEFPYKVEGYVYNSKGEPLYNIKVKMKDNNEERETFTDNDGYFIFKGISGRLVNLIIFDRKYGNFNKVIKIEELSTPLYITLHKEEKKIYGKIVGKVNLKKLEIKFYSENTKEPILGNISGNSYVLKVSNSGELVVYYDGKEIISKKIDMKGKNKVKFDINIGKMVVIRGYINKPDKNIPVFFRNKETGKMYMIKGYPDYQIEIPVGKYEIIFGEGKVIKEITINNEQKININIE